MSTNNITFQVYSLTLDSACVSRDDVNKQKLRVIIESGYKILYLAEFNKKDWTIDEISAHVIEATEGEYTHILWEDFHAQLAIAYNDNEIAIEV